MFNFMKRLKKNKKSQSGQGATEYILLLVAVVAILVLFRSQITQQVQQLLGNVSQGISQFSSSTP